MKTITYPVVGFGGTNVRCGIVSRQTQGGRFVGMPQIVHIDKLTCARKDIPLDTGCGTRSVVDLARTLSMAADSFKSSGQLVKFVGIDAPGAWLEEGIPYRGTTFNIPDLQGYKLADNFAQMLGPGWRAAVENDGVSHVLAIVQILLGNLKKFPEISEILSKQGSKLAGFVPGTGFGAGAFRINNGFARPIPGPQQFFDIALWAGPDVMHCGWVTPETACAGVGFTFQAMKTLLGTRYKEEELTGEFLTRLAFAQDSTIKKDEREAAIEIYRQAAKGLATTMELTYDGGDPKMSRKMAVNDPPHLESSFWKSVKSTRVFLLGGWLTDPAVKGFISDELSRLLAGHRKGLHFIFADDIPGVSEMAEPELIGASLLIPKEFATKA
ncbi:MAG: hypothetical protein WC527_00835 [Candidatus Margulisiibacteriota bacterium]